MRISGCVTRNDKHNYNFSFLITHDSVFRPNVRVLTEYTAEEKDDLSCLSVINYVVKSP